MLLNKNVLKLTGVASNDSTHYALQGVLIEADGSGVATDGHILLKVKPQMDCYNYAKEFPVISGLDVAGAFDETEKLGDDGKTETVSTPKEKLTPFILPSTAILQAVKAIPKKSRSLPVLEHVALDVSQTNNNGCAVLATTDLKNPQVFRPRKIEAQFPDYKKVLPKKAARITVGFSVEVLDKLVKTLKAMNVKVIGLGIRDELSVVSIEAKTEDCDEITGAVMPYSLPK